jgi:hypothetical protein
MGWCRSASGFGGLQPETMCAFYPGAWEYPIEGILADWNAC